MRERRADPVARRPGKNQILILLATGLHTTLKDAPGRSGPVTDPLRFSMRSPPPTVKHAGPALRLLAGDAEGDWVVLA